MADEPEAPNEYSRRSFFKRTLAGLGTASLIGGLGYYGFRRIKNLVPATLPVGMPIQSIDALGAQMFPESFTGQTESKAHQLLWNKASLMESGELPEVSKQIPLVIVGGGISGLLSAHYLKNYQPVLLEQDRRLGGNSKGEQWGDLSYSIGAAYIPNPDKYPPLKKLLKELDLHQAGRFENAQELPIIYKNKFINSFWDGLSDKENDLYFHIVWQKFEDVLKSSFPDIPVTKESDVTWQQVKNLDRMSFKDWLVQNCGKLHPHVDEFIQSYCFTSFAGTYDEVSAAQGLNFITWDIAGSVFLPGGNARIAQTIAQNLKRDLPPGHLQTGATVIDIAPNATGVVVTYQNGLGKLVRLQAKKCIVAAPKFVAKHLIQNIPGKQKEAMNAISYRGFVVGNVLIDQKIKSRSGELFVLRGKTPSRSSAPQLPYTDLVFGGFAQKDRPGHSALTLYKAFPYESGRQDLLQPNAFSDVKNQFERELPRHLKVLGIPEKSVKGLRIQRWGHALPLAKKGLIANGTLQRAQRNIDQKIYFVQQDNWANPSFDAALEAAIEVSTQIKGQLS